MMGPRRSVASSDSPGAGTGEGSTAAAAAAARLVAAGRAAARRRLVAGGFWDGLAAVFLGVAFFGDLLGIWPWSHTVTLFASMYIWELVHEGVMIHGSLATHHCCIVLLWQVAIGYYASRDWIRPEQLQAISDTGFAQLLCAGLEQPTFVCLCGWV
eukprot:COSAG01_NODE_2575_length_7433_cov_10.052495_4_plen_156_part_00